jgi:hypothetical protein
MGVMAVALLSPALPEIMDHFGISKVEIGLLVTAYTLPGVFMAIFIGVLADRLGRKQVLVPCIFLFGIAGGACIFSPDFHTLLILRVFQGIGGAGLVTLSITLIGDYFHGLERAEAMGLNASALSNCERYFDILAGSDGCSRIKSNRKISFSLFPKNFVHHRFYWIWRRFISHSLHPQRFMVCYSYANFWAWAWSRSAEYPNFYD